MRRQGSVAADDGLKDLKSNAMSHTSAVIMTPYLILEVLQPQGRLQDTVLISISGREIQYDNIRVIRLGILSSHI